VNKVLYIIGSLEVGGAEQHITQVAVYLKELGFKPEFFILKPGGELSTRLMNADIPIHYPSYPAGFFVLGRNNSKANSLLRALFQIWGMMKIMRSNNYDCVHFFLPAAYILGGIASLLSFRGPKVMSRRSLNDYQKNHPISLMVEKFLHPKMNKICANSLAISRQLLEEGVSEKKISLIYNGIDLSLFDRKIDGYDARKNLGIEQNSFVIIVVANLIPYKGHQDLLEALNLIKNSLPSSWVCIFAGRDDGIGADLKKIAKKFNISSHIKLLGSRKDIPQLLLASDVSILSSHQEGFSNAILEAMAAGLPVIATDVGGNSEAVLYDKSGILVPAKNPEKLASAIISLLDPIKRTEYGLQGKKRVSNLFSMSKIVESYVSLYKDLTP
jgi:glycosyltransferase involved in cell wall biosynthesis